MIVASPTPALLAHLVDTVATDPDGVSPLSNSIDEYRRHRDGDGHADVIGLLVVRASVVAEVLRLRVVDGIEICLVADTGEAQLRSAIEALGAARAPVRRVEIAVAKRGEDPLPGVRRLLSTAADLLPDTGEGPAVHAEIPLSGGLIDALDLLAPAAVKPPLGATFRLGGLAAELFPSPAALAGVVCACRDRGLRFTVNAGLQRAVRHNDPETGFTHHGALNLLAACLTATAGASVAAVAERLATTDPLPLLEAVRARRDAPRPLWTAMTSGRASDLVADLTGLALLPADSSASDSP